MIYLFQAGTENDLMFSLSIPNHITIIVMEIWWRWEWGHRPHVNCGFLLIKEQGFSIKNPPRVSQVPRWAPGPGFLPPRATSGYVYLRLLFLGLAAVLNQYYFFFHYSESTGKCSKQTKKISSEFNCWEKRSRLMVIPFVARSDAGCICLLNAVMSSISRRSQWRSIFIGKIMLASISEPAAGRPAYGLNYNHSHSHSYCIPWNQREVRDPSLTSFLKQRPWQNPRLILASWWIHFYFCFVFFTQGLLLWLQGSWLKWGIVQIHS